MVTMCIQSKTLSLALKGCKWGYLVFQRKRLEPRVLPWQQNGWCHSVPFVMYITGAKFEDYCFDISGDILDSVLYYLCGTIYRASGRSRKKKPNFAGFSGANSRKKRPISREFRGNFRGQFH